MSECVLCDTERLPDEAYGQVFAAYGQGPRRGLKARAAEPAAALARELCNDAAIDGDLVWRHFAYHRRPQPAPTGYLKRDRSLQDLHAARLSRRQMDILSLVCHLDVVSTPQLLPLLYGSLSTLGAQRAACYRDLRALIRGQYLYRSRAPRRRIPQAAPGGPVQYLHPGREAIAYAESALGHTPAAISREDEIDWDGVQRRGRANDVIVTLAAALGEARFVFGTDAGRVSIAPANWFGPGLLRARVSAPFAPKEQVSRPDGLVAVVIEVPARKQGALFPLAYVHEQPGWEEERVGAEARAWAIRMATAEGRTAPFADLGEIATPLLVISPDVDRVEMARAAITRALKDIPAVARPPVMLMSQAAAARAWSEPVVSMLDGTALPLHLAITTALPPTTVMPLLPVTHRLTAQTADTPPAFSAERRRERSVSQEAVWSGPLQPESGRRRRTAASADPTPGRSASTS